MSDLPTDDAAAAPARRSRWSSLLRIGFEFALLFGIALIAKQILAAASPGAYPNPLWLPVIVLSLQHGLAAGLAAAVIAAGMQYWGGLPPALMTEDMYAYIGRIAAEPVGWTCVALLIGHIRSLQIAQTRQLETELDERTRHSAAVADLCVDLRGRVEMLERQIAANAQASNADVAEAVIALEQASFDDFAERVTRFITLMTGAGEFCVYLLHGDALEAALRPHHEHGPTDSIVSDEPLFAAIVRERRLLSAARSADGALIGTRGSVAGPLVDAPGRVIGMLAIGETALDEDADDMARRFAFAAAELSRLIGRIRLIERWEAAASETQKASEPSQGQARPTGSLVAGRAGQAGDGNGAGATERAVDAPAAGGDSAPRKGRRRGDRAMTLQ